MNKLIPLLSLLLTLSFANAATLYPVVVNDRWGYVDKSGNLVVNPQFDQAEPFSGGLAAVKLGRWGYVDKSGKIAINPQFDKANAFSNNLAAVELDHRGGYVGMDGKYVVNPQFDGVGRSRMIGRRSN